VPVEIITKRPIEYRIAKENPVAVENLVEIKVP
jgi:hypothetical protein